MLRSLALTLLLSLTTACAISIDAVPENYSGEVAFVVDSIDIQADLDTHVTKEKIISFGLSKANDTRVLSSARSSLKDFNGSEESEALPPPVALTHKIPPQPQNIVIHGSVLYTEPPYTQFNGEGKAVYREYDIHPKPGNSYQVRGTANENDFDVWIEIPADISVVQDTFTEKKGAMADFFELTSINGEAVKTSYAATRTHNAGNGQHFSPVMMTHQLPLARTEIEVSGSIFFPTDIQSLLLDERHIEKKIVFKPTAGETYSVRGLITEHNKTLVWLEDSTGNRVGQ